MTRLHRKVLSIALLVAAVVIGLDAISNAIEADINQGTYSSRSKDTVLVNVVNGGFTKSEEDLTCSLLTNPTDYPNAQLVGTEDGTHGTYSLWLYEHPITTQSLRHVSMNYGGMCGIAFEEDFGGVITNRVPLDIARSLVYQMYSHFAERAGGVDVYGGRMLASISDNSGQGNHGYVDPALDQKLSIDSVDLWALNQLGINFPAGSYHLIDIDNAWQYDSQPVDVEL